MERIKIREAVVVEGKYDKVKLSSLLDAPIVETSGFRIYKDREQLALIRRLAKIRGILILTDSDAAGFQIRHFLAGAVPEGTIKHAYIPDLFGKEKRKDKPSAEGKLGVEGMPRKALLEALERAGVLAEEVSEPAGRPITKADLYEDGFTGQTDSAARRASLLRALNLPQRLSTNAMVSMLNSFLSYDEYRRAVDALPPLELEN